MINRNWLTPENRITTALRRPLPGRGQKKGSCPMIPWDRSLSTTLAVPPKLAHKAPARFRASDNARSPDNGRSPRRRYSGCDPFRLALIKSIHRVLACRDHTARGSLRGSVSLLLVFVIGFSVWSQYILIIRICQAQFEKFYKFLFRHFLITIREQMPAAVPLFGNAARPRASGCRAAASVL